MGSCFCFSSSKLALGWPALYHNFVQFSSFAVSLIHFYMRHPILVKFILQILIVLLNFVCFRSMICFWGKAAEGEACHCHLDSLLQELVFFLQELVFFSTRAGVFSMRVVVHLIHFYKSFSWNKFCQAQLQLQLWLRLDLIPISPATHPPKKYLNTIQTVTKTYKPQPQPQSQPQPQLRPHTQPKLELGTSSALACLDFF